MRLRHGAILPTVPNVLPACSLLSAISWHRGWLGQTIRSGQEMQDRLAWVKGNPFAKAALDLAWWDLYARCQNEALWRLLGGVNNVVDVGADLGVMESIDRLLEAIGASLKAGYKRINFKYRPGWEIEMVDAVHKAFPDAIFHVDCNSAYTLGDLAMFEVLDNYDLAMIEQPLMHDDLIDHAELQSRLRTPLCLDESVTSADKARKAIKIGACRWINIKPGRVGGLTPALDIHNLCQEAGIPCWIGGMLGRRWDRPTVLRWPRSPTSGTPLISFPATGSIRSMFPPRQSRCAALGKSALRQDPV